MNDKLKPCPFCGNTPDFLKAVHEESHIKRKGKGKKNTILKRCVIICTHCGAMGTPTEIIEEDAVHGLTYPYRVYIQQAVDNWNRRVSTELEKPM